MQCSRQGQLWTDFNQKLGRKAGFIVQTAAGDRNVTWGAVRRRGAMRGCCGAWPGNVGQRGQCWVIPGIAQHCSHCGARIVGAPLVDARIVIHCRTTMTMIAMMIVAGQWGAMNGITHTHQPKPPVGGLEAVGPQESLGFLAKKASEAGLFCQKRNRL